MKVNLSGQWKMRKSGETWIDAKVPGSVYSNLLEADLIDDPFWRENEYDAEKISMDDYEFEKKFIIDKDMLNNDRVILHFDGIDTLAEIILNGKLLGNANNMHRVWEYDIKEALKIGENVLLLKFASPIKFILEKHKERQLWGVTSTTEGYPHLRKAHYMFGWDWGPKLPDMGIWRDVYIIAANYGRLDSTYFTQKHEAGKVVLEGKIEAECYGNAELEAKIKITTPEGKLLTADTKLLEGKAVVEVDIENPQLWWPHGFGKQPLYNLTVELFNKELKVDERNYRIGLRTLTISRDKDQFGEEFCFMVNGVKVFAMGADYIPEDNIIGRCTKEKTDILLKQCIDANFNCIRVWGGGYYPEDWFFDLCDEYGLIVWHDFMYACAVYWMTDEFKENVTAETIDNVKRIRHHASLGLWCGNNEMEVAWKHWGLPDDAELKEDYFEQFEQLLPELVEKYDPNTYYWPSSPSSGGGFDKPNDSNIGDTHYWEVWHGMKPFEEFRKHYFRFCSEYGFESMPSIKTIEAVTLPKDRNIFSPVMEAHQKCDSGNMKLMYYMSEMFRFPKSFEMLVYGTQLLQADAIRSNVEHMRRNRGRCMGSVYWQVNDCNPVISWSSIDYFGRWKALHYYAKRFYTPVLLSVDEGDVSNIVFNISNETMNEAAGIVAWALRDNRAKIIRSGDFNAMVSPLSASNCYLLDLSDVLTDVYAKRGIYLEYTLLQNGKAVSSGTSLFVRPKHFEFLNPQIGYKISEKESSYLITLDANTFAKGVYLDLEKADCQFSDNWFDIHADKEVVITVEKSSLSSPLSMHEFRDQLKVVSNFDIG
jgi:beta-mannosidase